MFNGNPLLRFDGYYILADWLEIPNLRDRCNQFFQRLVLRHALGIRVRAEPGMSPGRRILFVGYAVASYLYLWLVAFGILWFLYTFLKPYNLGSIGALLACLAGLSMVGWPVVRLVTGLKKAGRVPEMNPRRVLTSGGMAAALVLAVCLVPLPISSICRTALVQVNPEASEKVYVPLPGILGRWHVRNGQAVGRGQVLAEFRHLDLENQLEEARTEYDVRTVHLAGLREQLGSTVDVADRQRIAGQLTAVENERSALVRQIAVFEKNLRRLEVRAPLSGIVLGGPQIDEVGKRWDDPDRPLCSIAEPGRLQALVPLDPADYRLVREDIDRLAVSVRSPGHGRRRWTGQVASLPESEARDIPLALSNRGGGPVAVQVGRHSLVPLSQQYLVAVDIVDPMPSIYPGTLVQVKVTCRWQTLRWWLWRTLSATFDVGLW
jgi:putative peptide zinc metalloprotease protein